MRAELLEAAVVASREEAVVLDGAGTPRVTPSRALAADRSLRTIEEIYREHAARFRRVAYAIVRDPETAEDVVQEAFAKAIVGRGSFRGSGDPVAWVWRIVVNTALSRRRRRRFEALVFERPTVVSDAGADATASDSRVREHVARLPKRQKLALFLHYYADMEYETIGRVLSVAPGTVGKLMYDARASMRRALEGDSDE